MSGWHPPRPVHPLVRAARALRIDPSLIAPTSDLRPLSPAVNDQEQEGSCTAQSTTKAAEVTSAKEGSRIRLASQWAYAKGRERQGTPLSEDGGSTVENMIMLLAEEGCPLEQDYPYDAHSWTEDPGDALDAEALQHKALFYYECPTLDTAKASLCQGFPCAFGFTVFARMMSDDVARSGMVPYPGAGESQDGGHAVLMMGHDDNLVIESERGAVLCLNSWGVFWGLGGYFWLPYRYFYDGLAGDIWTVRKVAA